MECFLAYFGNFGKLLGKIVSCALRRDGGGGGGVGRISLDLADVCGSASVAGATALSSSKAD